jgi:hypothetical protein
LDAADAESYRCPKAPVAHEELWVMDTDGMPVNVEMSPMEAVAWADLMDRAASAYVDEDVVVAWIRFHGVTDPDAVDLAEIEDNGRPARQTRTKTLRGRCGNRRVRVTRTPPGRTGASTGRGRRVS